MNLLQRSYHKIAPPLSIRRQFFDLMKCTNISFRQDDKTRNEFANMKVKDLLNHPAEYVDQAFVRSLSSQKNLELASTTALIASKK